MSVCEIIGKTPYMRLCGTEKRHNLGASVFAKLECFNPTGSAKDRAALFMINDAEKRGLLSENGIIVEPTSGNTGIGLASVAAARGYRVILTMPASMSIERRKLLCGYGAELVLTDSALGMAGSVEKAKELVKSLDNAFMPDQFSNPANAKAHYMTTGREIYRQSLKQGATPDFLVAGVGTGGTITGTGRYLKKMLPNIKIIAVEPASSPLLSGGKAGSHGIQGIGANFVPKLLDTNLLDDVFDITDDEAFENAREFAKTEGVSVGISSGAALAAALKIAKNPQNFGKSVAVVLPDSGDRYLSTALFS